MITDQCPQVLGIEPVALVTRTGTRFRVERADKADWQELKDFFRRLPGDDLRRRFLASMKEPSDHEVSAMLDEAEAITFFARDPAGGQLIAVATLSRGSTDREAEVAIATRPDWKHHGVSWTLLEHVISFARADGYELLWSLEAGDNREAINLEREMGFLARLNRAEPVEVLVSKRLIDG